MDDNNTKEHQKISVNKNGQSVSDVNQNFVDETTRASRPFFLGGLKNNVTQDTGWSFPRSLSSISSSSTPMSGFVTPETPGSLNLKLFPDPMKQIEMLMQEGNTPTLLQPSTKIPSFSKSSDSRVGSTINENLTQQNIMDKKLNNFGCSSQEGIPGKNSSGSFNVSRPGQLHIPYEPTSSAVRSEELNIPFSGKHYSAPFFNPNFAISPFTPSPMNIPKMAARTPIPVSNFSNQLDNLDPMNAYNVGVGDALQTSMENNQFNAAAQFSLAAMQINSYLAFLQQGSTRMPELPTMQQNNGQYGFDQQKFQPTSSTLQVLSSSESGNYFSDAVMANKVPQSEMKSVITARPTVLGKLFCHI